MAEKIYMPDLGELVGKGIILLWHKNIGDEVEAGDPLLEITVDKATYLIESEEEGVLLHICAVEGDFVPSGSVIAYCGEYDEYIPDEIKEIKYPQSQPDSCLIYRDKLDLQSNICNAEKLSAMRKVISERMIKSKKDAPHFYLTTSVDMTGCIDLRKKLRTEKHLKVTYNDMIIKACALALKKYPTVASIYTAEGYIHRNRINVGFAVALEPDGLEVLVVKNADNVSLSDVADSTKVLIDKARNKKLLPDDFSGSVFTVSNLGAFDVDSFTAIINPGESAILAISKVKDTPCAEGGEFVIKPMMNIVLSSDHRTIDGVLAARFNTYVKKLLESPNSLI